MIIDGETVITGCFNFTKAGEENDAENLLVIHDKHLMNRITIDRQNVPPQSEWRYVLRQFKIALTI